MRMPNKASSSVLKTRQKFLAVVSEISSVIVLPGVAPPCMISPAILFLFCFLLSCAIYNFYDFVCERINRGDLLSMRCAVNGTFVRPVRTQAPFIKGPLTTHGSHIPSVGKPNFHNKQTSVNTRSAAIRSSSCTLSPTGSAGIAQDCLLRFRFSERQLYTRACCWSALILSMENSLCVSELQHQLGSGWVHVFDRAVFLHPYTYQHRSPHNVLGL